MVATPPPYVSLCESALSFGLSLALPPFGSALVNRLRAFNRWVAIPQRRAGKRKSAFQKIAGVVSLR